MLKIAAIIVTFNRLDKLTKAIDSILAEEIDQIIVVNNKSSDGTEEWLGSKSKKDPRFIILNLEENTGGAGGFYHGCKYASESTDCNWLLLFDDDAYPAPGLIKKFKKIEKPDEVGAISCAVRTPDGKISNFNRPGFNPFKSIRNIFSYLSKGPYPSYEELENSNGIEVDYSSFVGFFFRTDLIDLGLGLPKPELFIYADDWIYSLTLSQLGYKNLYYSDLRFYHDSPTLVDSYYDAQLWRKYYICRNSLLFYKKASGLFFPLVFTIKLFKWLIDIRFYKNKMEYLNTLRRALRDSIKLNA